MKKALIVNAHQKHDFSPGGLNEAVANKIAEYLQAKDYEVKRTNVDSEYDIEEEVTKHQWADVVVLQSPIYWMGVPWGAKKYMDEVYMAGLDGRLCNTDGRSSKSPKKNYGTGGSLIGKKYMVSLTFNAPKEAFNDEAEYLFKGKSVDDLIFWIHCNFRFFGMDTLETFACFDVLKNPDVENDFIRLQKHLDKQFSTT